MDSTWGPWEKLPTQVTEAEQTGLPLPPHPRAGQGSQERATHDHGAKCVLKNGLAGPQSLTVPQGCSSTDRCHWRVPIPHSSLRSPTCTWRDRCSSLRGWRGRLT